MANYELRAVQFAHSAVLSFVHLSLASLGAFAGPGVSFQHADEIFKAALRSREA